jgi:NADH:ubiquinone oxidoreductase subunit 2 (subunit N)
MNSVLASYYYLRVLQKMYMSDPAPGAPRAEPMQSGFVAITLVAAAVLVLYFGIAPGRYLDLAIEAVRQATPS